jgi:hypothetical protein
LQRKAGCYAYFEMAKSYDTFKKIQFEITGAAAGSKWQTLSIRQELFSFLFCLMFEKYPYLSRPRDAGSSVGSIILYLAKLKAITRSG